MSGTSAMEIMEALGVSSLKMVQRYTHLTKGHMASVVERLVENTGVGVPAMV